MVAKVTVNYKYFWIQCSPTTEMTNGIASLKATMIFILTHSKIKRMFIPVSPRKPSQSSTPKTLLNFPTENPRNPTGPQKRMRGWRKSSPSMDPKIGQTSQNISPPGPANNADKGGTITWEMELTRVSGQLINIGFCIWVSELMAKSGLQFQGFCPAEQTTQ